MAALDANAPISRVGSQRGAPFCTRTRVSRDGKYALLHEPGYGVHIYNHDQQGFVSLESREAAVYLWFTPDYAKYVTSSADFAVRFYEIPFQRELLVLDGFPGRPGYSE